MVGKEILFGRKAQTRVGAGLHLVADTVKLTLGPAGRNVGVESPRGPPTITKDGASVAEELEFSNRFVNLGAQLVKEAAAATASTAGDGTTTATILAQAIYFEGSKLVAAGVDPMALKRGIDIAVGRVVADLARQSKPVQTEAELEQVATVSTNGDAQMGRLIASAITRVGKQGAVVVDVGSSTQTTMEFSLGIKLDRGYLSPYFAHGEEQTSVNVKDAYVLVHDGRIATADLLMPLMEKVAATSQPLFVVADVEGEALALLVLNHVRGSLKVCAVKPPGYGDNRLQYLADIAALVGTTLVDASSGKRLQDVELADLGRAELVTVDLTSTVIIGGQGDREQVQRRISVIQNELEEATSEPMRIVLRARVAQLAGGVATIKVGAFTELEMQEKRARIDDALHATRAAAEEGIVPGGGVALIRALSAIDASSLPEPERFGADIVWKALQQPLFQIAKNSGLEGAVIVEQVRALEGPVGYNVRTREFEDLLAAGIIDPTKVVRVGLVNAASVASMLLTVSVCVAENTPRRISSGNEANFA